MPILPEPKVRCPKCFATVMDIDPKWIAEATLKTYDGSGKEIGNPWSYIRNKMLAQYREFGALKGWMTQGQCPEKDCDGQWWDGKKLSIWVPTHLKKVKEMDSGTAGNSPHSSGLE